MPHSRSLPIVKAWLREKGVFTLPSNGFSMFPAIRPGDACAFEPAIERELAVGDIVLFENNDGILVGHRLVRIEEDASGKRYVCKGDANLHADRPVTFERIAGRLLAIRRRRDGSRTGRISCGSLPMTVWGLTMIRFPAISLLLRKWVERRT